MDITHAKVSAKSDGGDSSLVLPSDWNAAHVITGLSPAFIGARAKWVSGAMPSTGSYVGVPLNGEDFDTDGFHDNSTNNQRMTIPAGLGGKYLLIGAFYGGSGGFYSRFYNGTTDWITYGVNGGDNIGTVTVVADLAAGDHVDFQVNALSSTTIYGASFSLVKLDSGKVGNGIGAAAYHSTTQNISAATWTALLLDSESFDTDGFHDTSTNTSRLTIPAGLGGKYIVTGRTYPNNFDNDQIIAIRVNGAEQAAPGRALWTTGGSSINRRNTMAVTDVLQLNATDYVELFAYTTGGGNMGGANYETKFSIMRLDSGGTNLTIEEADGSPTGQVTKIVVPNGLLSISNGVGTLAAERSGSWTASLKFGGNSTGITYAYQSGTWVRQGSIVMVWVAIVLTSKGSSTGGATVTGLPFTQANSDSMGGYSTYTANANNQLVPGALGASSTAIAVNKPGSSFSQATDGDFNNNTSWYFTAFYTTTDA